MLIYTLSVWHTKACLNSVTKCVHLYIVCTRLCLLLTFYNSNILLTCSPKEKVIAMHYIDVKHSLLYK